MNAQPVPSSMVPGLRRNMVTTCAMTATIMQALDTTIANVALPHMQGTMGATQEQITWVLTSYIVAAAIFMPLTGYLTDRFGRKRVFMWSVVGFTVASMLCGTAQSLSQIVLYRLAQGVFGACLVPLSQAVLLEAFAPQDRELRSGPRAQRADGALEQMIGESINLYSDGLPDGDIGEVRFLGVGVDPGI